MVALAWLDLLKFLKLANFLVETFVHWRLLGDCNGDRIIFVIIAIIEEIVAPRLIVYVASHDKFKRVALKADCTNIYQTCN